MAQQLSCDICQEEPAAQMLTNLESGVVMTLGMNCLPQFYGQSILTLLEAGEHKGPANRCQACRRFHERMTTPVTPIDVGESNVSRETSQPAEPAAETGAP